MRSISVPAICEVPTTLSPFSTLRLETMAVNRGVDYGFGQVLLGLVERGYGAFNVVLCCVELFAGHLILCGRCLKLLQGDGFLPVELLVAQVVLLCLGEGGFLLLVLGPGRVQGGGSPVPQRDVHVLLYLDDQTASADTVSLLYIELDDLTRDIGGNLDFRNGVNLAVGRYSLHYRAYGRLRNSDRHSIFPVEDRVYNGSHNNHGHGCQNSSKCFILFLFHNCPL